MPFVLRDGPAEQAARDAKKPRKRAKVRPAAPSQGRPVFTLSVDQNLGEYWGHVAMDGLCIAFNGSIGVLSKGFSSSMLEMLPVLLAAITPHTRASVGVPPTPAETDFSKHAKAKVKPKSYNHRTTKKRTKLKPS